MDVTKSSESSITVTVSVTVDLRTLLEDGMESFAVQCRAALEEELAPIMGIGSRGTMPAPAPVLAPIVSAAVDNFTQPTETVEVSHDEFDIGTSPAESLDAQMPPSQRRGRE